MSLDDTIADVVVFRLIRQMILSDDQTHNHLRMIMCAGLQLHTGMLKVYSGQKNELAKTILAV